MQPTNEPLLLLIAFIFAAIGWVLGSAWKYICTKNEARREYARGYRDCEDYLAARDRQLRADAEPTDPACDPEGDPITVEGCECGYCRAVRGESQPSAA